MTKEELLKFILKSNYSPLLYGSFLMGFLLDEEIKVESDYPGAQENRTIDPGFLKSGFAAGINLSLKNNLILKTGLFW